LVVNTLSLNENNEIVDVKELFLSKLDAIENIVGLAPDTLNTLAKLGEAINNDSTFYQSLITDLSFKANAADTYTKAQSYSEEEVNDMFNQTLSHLTDALALKANAVETYARGTIDHNIAALRTGTATKLGLNYNKDEVFNTYEIHDMFSQTLTSFTDSLATLQTDTDTKLGLKHNKVEVFNTYEFNDMFTQTITALADGLATKANVSALTDGLATKANVSGVYTTTQVDNLLIANNPYLVQEPLQRVVVIDPSRAGTKLKLRIDFANIPELSVSDNIYSNGNLLLTDLTAYNKTEINAQRAGILSPSKVDIITDAWGQISIKSNSDTANLPSDITLNRQIKKQFLVSAMGVSGDTARGAYWWAGGTDRININCETGIVNV
jgi:hypothetical protein